VLRIFHIICFGTRVRNQTNRSLPRVRVLIKFMIDIALAFSSKLDFVPQPCE
jgi:hypothetical protein